MKKNINLIILPLYRCNQNCPYCLFGHLKNTTNTLDLVELDTKLTELSLHFNIQDITIDGGEISLLSDIYFDLLYKLIRTYNKKIQVITNFIEYNKSLINGADVIEVGYNPNGYSLQSDIIKTNIKAASAIGKIIKVKSLDVACEIKPDNIITELNDLKIKSWEIIPYQKTKYTNILKKSPEYFEKIINSYINKIKQMNFSFINKLEIDGIIKRNNYDTKTIYITPMNKYGIGVYTNAEFEIKEYENIIELQEEILKQENKQAIKCKDCNNKTKCLANRYCNLDDITKFSCPGFKNLIK